MNGITNWFQNIDMGDPNWVMAICAILTIIGGAGAFIVKKLIGLVSKASRKETPAEGPATPITNDEIDAMFPATTPATRQPSRHLQRFRIIRTTKKEIDAHIEEISNAGQVAQGERSRAAHFVGKGLLMHTESGSKVALRNSVLPE